MVNRMLVRQRKGFTLIEALIAMTLLAVILPVAMQGISAAISLSTEARRRSEAATLARWKLDELVTTRVWISSQGSSRFEEPWSDYHWTLTAEDWQSGLMTQLTVEVTWTARQKQQSVSMTTLVSNQ